MCVRRCTHERRDNSNGNGGNAGVYRRKTTSRSDSNFAANRIRMGPDRQTTLCQNWPPQTFPLAERRSRTFAPATRRGPMSTCSSLARQCPRFPSCSVNRCPLDDDYPNQFVHPDDRERRCMMEKGVRVRIAATEPGRLAMSGLTVPEHAATKCYESKPLAVRLNMAKQGKATLAAHRKDNRNEK